MVLMASMPVALAAQDGGRLSGTVVDRPNAAALPGVRVRVMVSGVERSAMTDADGRYELRVPAGTYSVIVELAGFEPAIRQDVDVVDGETTEVRFALQVGCLDEAQRVDRGFAWALHEADSIVHVRIVQSSTGEPCPASGFCVCTEHLAVVDGVVKAPPGGLPREIALLQEGAGRIGAGARLGSEKPYAAGQEYIAFLRRNAGSHRYAPLAGSLFMFPIRRGRVEFQRTDAPGLRNRMTVDDFEQAIRLVAGR